MKKWILIFLFTFLPSFVFAQNHFLLQWGFGAGSFEEASAFNLNLGMYKNHHQVMTRVNINGELLGDVLEDYALVWHYVFSSDKVLASAGTGFSVIRWEESHGLFEESEFHGPIAGLPIEGQIFWRPLKFAGIGFYGIINLNGEKTCASLALNLQIGNLR